MALRLAQDPAADALLTDDPFALMMGMLLDQQFPMERAFAAPYLLAQRLGRDHLDAAQLAEYPPEDLVALFTGPPALHRYPGSMAGRVQDLARIIVDDYGGDAAAVWRDVETGEELRRRLDALPGFGRQKVQIFIALLGKQLGVRPDGWRQAAGAYGEDGSRRSVADVTDEKSLAEVRAYKKQAKQAARAG